MSSRRDKRTPSILSIALPAAIAGILGTGLISQLGYMDARQGGTVDTPVTISIPSGVSEYRDYGDFFKDGYAVDGPIVRIQSSGALAIMKFQVTESEYARCVLADRCEAVAEEHAHRGDYPVTGVSYDDAKRYARWLSDVTGEVWQLPTHGQIVRAAGSKFTDDALGVDPDTRNPALRWLADYERETRRKLEGDTQPKPGGHFGENEFGLADFAGNVWEWTATCHRRVDLSARSFTSSSSCGIFVTVGQHRSPMSSFIRDPKTGGCSVGAPPANLGFRLVRDDRWYADLLKRLRDRGVTL